MELSTEVRWFWPVEQPHLTARLESWFQGLGSFPPGGGRHREDVYLFEPGLEKLGIKERGGKPGVEIKAQLGSREALWGAPVELWSKWSAQGLALDPQGRVVTRKMRRLRKFDLDGAEPVQIELRADEKPAGQALPTVGCNLELTRVELPAQRQEWWTLGLEAFAPELEQAHTALRRLADALEKPELEGARAASYPAWLSSF